jgi:hypothetical protein
MQVSVAFGWCSWLSRLPNTQKVPSSILGSNTLFCKKKKKKKGHPQPIPTGTSLLGGKKKCILRGSNSRGHCPMGLKSIALTTRPRMLVCLPNSRPSGAMDSASDFGSGGWGFESLLGLLFFFFFSWHRRTRAVRSRSTAWQSVSHVRMAQWIRRLPTEQEIPGSSPGMDSFFFFFSVDAQDG